MIIIPARLYSTRLPKKPIQLLGNKPIIIWVAKVAQKIDKTFVATDSEEIMQVCAKYNINSILTKSTHTSGTDRVCEAAYILQKQHHIKDDDIIINIQGDEPFIEPSLIEMFKNKVISIKNKDDFFMASCYKEETTDKIQNPNIVKVVIGAQNQALYFSRSPIPFHRDNKAQNTFYAHMGIYAFTLKSLKEFISLPKSRLEDIEKLEQLRALDNGKNIFMIHAQSKSFGIDTQEDLQKAQREMI